MYTHACTRKHTPNMRSQSSGCRSLFRVTTLPTNKKLRYTNLCNKVGREKTKTRSPPSWAIDPLPTTLSPEAII